MLLSLLHETASSKDAARRLMNAGWPRLTEDEDYVIEDDGSISEPPDVGIYEMTVPRQWDELPVKFNACPNLELVATKDGKLKSLVNFPRELKELRLYGVGSLASLKHGPRVVGQLVVSECGVTSLTGAPSANVVQLIGLKRLTDLRGFEERSVSLFDVSDCEGLKSLDGAPISMEHLAISNCHNLDVIKLDNSRFVGKGKLSIESALAYKLSPSLVMVPGLKEIVDMTHDSFRKDILQLFNKHLNQPNPRSAYLALQQDLIDANLEHVAEL